jgi:hypothetical protein
MNGAKKTSGDHDQAPAFNVWKEGKHECSGTESNEYLGNLDLVMLDLFWHSSLGRQHYKEAGSRWNNTSMCTTGRPGRHTRFEYAGGKEERT